MSKHTLLRAARERQPAELAARAASLEDMGLPSTHMRDDRRAVRDAAPRMSAAPLYPAPARISARGRASRGRRCSGSSTISSRAVSAAAALRIPLRTSAQNNRSLPAFRRRSEGYRQHTHAFPSARTSVGCRQFGVQLRLRAGAAQPGPPAQRARRVCCKRRRGACCFSRLRWREDDAAAYRVPRQLHAAKTAARSGSTDGRDRTGNPRVLRQHTGKARRCSISGSWLALDARRSSHAAQARRARVIRHGAEVGAESRSAPTRSRAGSRSSPPRHAAWETASRAHRRGKTARPARSRAGSPSARAAIFAAQRTPSRRAHTPPWGRAAAKRPGP